MSTWNRLMQGGTTIDFVGNRRRWFIISAVALVVSLLALALLRLNLGIEFVGGLGVQGPNPAESSVAEIRSALEQIGVTESTVQLVEEGSGFRVTTPELAPGAEQQVVDALAEVTGSDPDDISVEVVGPTFGALIARRALVALGVFIGAVILFISWRLELKMALAGMAALVHDLIITVGVYAVTQFPVTPATVVAVLTVLGYSLYDTVVVFDKVDELVELEDDKPYTEIVNQAMNTVLARSLATSLTSILPVASILFVGSFLLGADTLRDFALALFVGIIVGAYSSIFIATPLLAIWKEREPEWVQRAERVERRERAGRR